MRSIAILSEKGGTGKTTTALNLAAGLAAAEHRVLVIDTDPQANATWDLTRGAPVLSPTIAHVLLGRYSLEQALLPTHWPGVDCVPADSELAEANKQLSVERGGDRRLRKALAALTRGYDFVIVDASPQRTMVNDNVLNAVGEVIVPVDPSLYSLLGIKQVFASVDDVRERLDNFQLRVAGLLLTRLRKDNVARQVEGELRAHYPGLVFRSGIPHNVKVEEAHSRFLAVVTYAPRSPGARAYAGFAYEVLHGIGAAPEEHGTGDQCGDVAPEDRAAAAAASANGGSGAGTAAAAAGDAA